MPTAAEKERAKAGIKARQDAIKSLIANHQDEFDEMVTRNRVAAGLPLRPQGPTKQELEDRVRRAEAQIAKWRKELDAA